jgi:hypothetical protein
MTNRKRTDNIMTNRKRTENINNDLQNTKDWVTRTTYTKTRDGLRCYSGVSSSCSTNVTRSMASFPCIFMSNILCRYKVIYDGCFLFAYRKHEDGYDCTISPCKGLSSWVLRAESKIFLMWHVVWLLFFDNRTTTPKVSFTCVRLTKHTPQWTKLKWALRVWKISCSLHVIPNLIILCKVKLCNHIHPHVFLTCNVLLTTKWTTLGKTGIDWLIVA